MGALPVHCHLKLVQAHGQLRRPKERESSQPERRSDPFWLHGQQSATCMILFIANMNMKL